MSILVVGFDGCREGWIGALWRGPGSRPEATFLKSLRTAEQDLPGEVMTVAVDIPLGLQDAATPGGRACDIAARRMLGPRRSSVFSPPARRALAATTHTEAAALNRDSGIHAPSLTIQSFGIFGKLRDADEALEASRWLRERAIEVHPEICFCAIPGGPPPSGKKRPEGKEQRRRLLENAGFAGVDTFEVEARGYRAATDDALDACVAAWSAYRYARREALCLPNGAVGPSYAMRIWY